MTTWLLSGGNASSNPKYIQTVSLATSLTNNLLIIANFLRLYSVPLKFTSIHSSPGLSSTGTIWTIILCALIQLTASGGPSIIGTNYSSQLSPVASMLKGPATYRFRFRFRFSLRSTCWDGDPKQTSCPRERANENNLSLPFVLGRFDLGHFVSIGIR